MIDVHNFRFQSSDGGVSTSTTGSRSSVPFCLRPMTREYELLFFRFSLCFFPPLLVPYPTRFHSTHLPLSSLARSLYFLSLFSSLCTSSTNHYFLFVTLYDELVQVRCSRREAFTRSPFPFPTIVILYLAFLAALIQAFHGCPRFTYFTSAFVSRFLSAFKTQHLLTMLSCESQ